jgi:hypothetical protein
MMATLEFASIVYAALSLLGGQGPGRESVLFIGTRFRKCYTAVDSIEVGPMQEAVKVSQ